MNTWYADSTGQFALSMQKKLLQQSVAAWPRQGRRLLEVNCGQGLFLPLLWECGFDVTATEPRPEPRQAAATQMAARAEIFAAADDHLPFEDDAFDWLVLHLTAQDMQSAALAVDEALRVTSAGLAVAFWNSASLPHLLHRLGGRKRPWPAQAHCWWQVWRKLKSLGIGHMCGMSALAAPQGTWRDTCALACCNRGLRKLPLGAWGIIRLDLAPARTVTPLPLRLEGNRLRQPEPAMECTHKTALHAQKTRPELP